MNKARDVAYQILKDVILSSKYVNIALKEHVLEGSEGNLVTQIVYGTLQHERYLAYQWEDLVVKQPKPSIGILLNMAMYQHVFLSKIPDYAIIKETVDLAKKAEKGQYANFVNAILRKLFARPLRPVVFQQKHMALAVETSHPDWLTHMLIKQYGYDLASNILHINNQPPKLYGREQKTSTSQAQVSELWAKEVELYPDSLLLKKDVLSSQAFKEGKIIIQDLHSQQVAVFMDPQPNDRVLDMCSAPGTKTMHIADLMNNQGEIVAVDLHAHRIELVNQLAAKTQVNIVKTLVADATLLNQMVEPNSFDAILLDAPCSGIGVFRRKPDKKRTISPNDLDELQKIQRQLLSSAATLVRNGKTITYATCTINRKENEKQVEWFLNQFPDFECVDSRLLLPTEDDADGFYMAKLRKKK